LALRHARLIRISFKRIGGAVASDSGKNGLAELLAFAFPDSFDLEKVGLCGRSSPGHVSQCGVAEDYVSRDSPLGGKGPAEISEGLEQSLIDPLPTNRLRPWRLWPAFWPASAGVASLDR